MDAVQAAQASLGAIEFNARDYYVVPGAWEKAREEMRDRRAALARIHGELEAVATHCSDAVAEREARRAETERRFK